MRLGIALLHQSHDECQWGAYVSRRASPAARQDDDGGSAAASAGVRPPRVQAPAAKRRRVIIDDENDNDEVVVVHSSDENDSDFEVRRYHPSVFGRFCSLLKALEFNPYTPSRSSQGITVTAGPDVLRTCSYFYSLSAAFPVAATAACTNCPEGLLFDLSSSMPYSMCFSPHEPVHHDYYPQALMRS